MLTDDQKKALSRVVGFDVFNTPDVILETFRQLADDQLAKTTRCRYCGKCIFNRPWKGTFCNGVCQSSYNNRKTGHRKREPGIYNRIFEFPGSVLKRARIARNMTCKQVAEILGCNTNTIVHFEINYETSRSPLYRKYMDFLGVTDEQLDNERDDGDDVRND